MLTRHLEAQRGIISAALAACTAFGVGPAVAGPTTPEAKKSKRKYYSTELRPYTAKSLPDHGLKDELSPQGRRARGFYITPYYLLRVGSKRTARVMKSAHLNAVVIDVKDDWGQILWPSKIALSKGVQRHLLKDPRRTIKRFHEAGIYVIARIVCFKDSKLPLVRPDLSVRFKNPKGKRLFRAGAGWLDAYSAEVQDYIIDIAREWESFGVDEVQIDYIRFPKGRAATYGLWLHQANDKRDRSTLIAQFLERLDRALKIPMSVDIYGLTTLVDGDPRQLGQTIEYMAKYVEAISPMMYANGMTTYFKNATITKGVYNLIQCGLWRARLKAPNIALRPYLQAYPNNVPFFGPEFVQRQVEAARRAGADGFLFWNSTMKNSVAYGALRAMKRRLVTFGRDTKAQVDQHRPGAWCKPPGKGNVFNKRRAGGDRSEGPTRAAALR